MKNSANQPIFCKKFFLWLLLSFFPLSFFFSDNNQPINMPTAFTFKIPDLREETLVAFDQGTFKVRFLVKMEKTNSGHSRLVNIHAVTDSHSPILKGIMGYAAFTWEPKKHTSTLLRTVDSFWNAEKDVVEDVVEDSHGRVIKGAFIKPLSYNEGDTPQSPRIWMSNGIEMGLSVVSDPQFELTIYVNTITLGV